MMACVTMKRSHDWDLKHPSDSSPSPSSSSSSATGTDRAVTVRVAGGSSPTHEMSSLSLSESGPRPKKRLCWSHVSQSSSAATLSPSPSPFGEVLPRVTANEIATNIREEIKRLQNRRQLHTANNPHQGDESVDHIDLAETFLGDVFLLEECHSGNHDLSSPSNHVRQNAVRSTANQPSTSSPTTTTGGTSSSTPSSSSLLRDQPLFTPRQVGYLCERILRARESQIRQEYDRVLSSKLAEQYEAFAKFTQDQIHRKFDKDSIPSYLS